MRYLALIIKVWALAILSWLWMTCYCENARAQSLEEDINMLVYNAVEVYAEEDTGSTLDQVLQRVRTNPSPYIAAIEQAFVFPDDDSLLAYPKIIKQWRWDYQGLLGFLKVIKAPEAQDLLIDVYYQTAEDLDTLQVRLKPVLDRLTGPWHYDLEARELIYAVSTAENLHNIALHNLGSLDNASVLYHAAGRYEKTTNGARPGIQMYSLRITGEFPPPPPIDLPDLPATLVFASDSVAAAFSDKRFTISGFDHFLTGQPSGSGQNLHAIATTTGPAKKGIKAALTNQQAKRILGIGPVPDLFRTTLSFDPAILIDELLALATDTLTATPTQNVGSLENPVIAYAPSGLTLNDTFEGYGILIVDGVLKGQQRFHWKGLVIVRSRGSVPPKLKVQNNFKITGGVLFYNTSALPAGLEVSGKAKLRHSVEAFQMIESSFSSALEAALLSK